MSYSTVFEIYSEGEMIYQKHTSLINHIGFDEDSVLALHISEKRITFYGGIMVRKFLINEIDSILIYSQNAFRNKVFSQIKIDIRGLPVNIKETRGNLHGDDEVTYEKAVHSIIESYSASNTVDTTYSNYHCFECYSYKNKGDLFICTNEISGEDKSTGISKDCSYKFTTIYFDTSGTKIDSIYFSFRDTYRWDSYSYPMFNDENDSKWFKLQNVEFTTNEEGEILIDYAINDFENFQYGYSKSFYFGSISKYTDNFSAQFIGFDPPTEPITIKIVIK